MTDDDALSRRTLENHIATTPSGHFVLLGGHCAVASLPQAVKGGRLRH